MQQQGGGREGGRETNGGWEDGTPFGGEWSNVAGREDADGSRKKKLRVLFRSRTLDQLGRRETGGISEAGSAHELVY